MDNSYWSMTYLKQALACCNELRFTDSLTLHLCTRDEVCDRLFLWLLPFQNAIQCAISRHLTWKTGFIWMISRWYLKVVDLFSGVQAMDKYARSVNNSVFTNAVASIALSAPDKVYKLIGRTINLNYHHYANDIYIPYDESGSYHLEHANYVRGNHL